MDKKELIYILYKNSEDLKIRQLIAEIIQKICLQAITIFFKKAISIPSLPEEISELKKILKIESISNQELLEVLIEFYFEKVREQLKKRA
ncbi:MAG: hypothetical protein A2Y82_03370 [Candidatus Buchananbacteria bacterium RBG_13_36_9]|uniref:Uncharacterized protein n=1 Tax=Candidatus Buchananbacteria bacterium RBG_13_36_9 TaxID=1797530 RepID=A0A1G1XMJ1_9BACT|nr:MAG: hypothetical protein A2Y82_03370 [Candidatus Buchananbacteria bacterium RBG_13_36_9]